jgi:hypothetical protein
MMSMFSDLIIYLLKVAKIERLIDFNYLRNSVVRIVLAAKKQVIAKL